LLPVKVVGQSVIAKLNSDYEKRMNIVLRIKKGADQIRFKVF